MEKKRLVLVGNGMAGVRCIEEILKLNPTGFDITIFGSEPHVNYNRILLSSVLQGGTTIKDITLHDRQWYERHHLRLYSGETVTKIDKTGQAVISDHHRIVPYDQLILATGSVPISLPIPGAELEGVITFRTIEDCQQMVEASKKFKKAVVIGGGLLGLEAARGLLNLGMEVNVVHIARYLMERQLDEKAAKMLQKNLESQGMKLLLEKETQEINGERRVEGVRFKDGSEVEADLVVMAAGVRPNLQLAKEAGIETNRAILVNDYMETSETNIFAVGECVEHRGMVYGLVQPLYEQGKILAKRICGIKGKGYHGSVLSTQLKISGVDLFSVGIIQEDSTSKSIKIYDEESVVYKKVVFQDQKIIGAVLYGDTKERSRLLDMIKKQQDVSDIEKVSLFPSAKEDSMNVSSFPASKIICHCNSVTKEAILEAVQREGLTTVEGIKNCTKASGSCGGCKPIVNELLIYAKSDSYKGEYIMGKSALCACTGLNDDDIVMEIQQKGLSSLREVIDVLDWNNPQGCPICRPAINFYLGMIYPEYEINSESFFVNEKMNATLQSNGLYTIIPQMYGGIASVEQLRKIAEVAKKYNISDVAVTSEQRIHLLNVKKEDLQAVCLDLNMPLSSPHGNKVQNIKTCIGEHICSCDKQPSLKLAAALEKQLEFLSTPYRVKIGVSACLHNGAGSTTKDVGVIRTDRGWEIYIAGSSGRHIRSGELLCVAPATEEVIEIVCGFVQYYRETANFMERTWEWLERVGLTHVREVLFDQDIRKQLLVHLEEEMVFRRRFDSNQKKRVKKHV